jgi:hypothetical protein
MALPIVVSVLSTDATDAIMMERAAHWCRRAAGDPG